MNHHLSKKAYLFSRQGISLLLFSWAIVLGVACTSFAANPLRLIVDGRDITSSAAPIIQNGRTLVPLRLISNELGAAVEWQSQDRSIRISQGVRNVRLRLNSFLVAYSAPDIKYGLCDVTPQIINEQTYLPLRLVSNILGVEITWQESNRTITIDSAKMVMDRPFFDMKIKSLQSDQVINGARNLQCEFPTKIPGGVEIKYLLLSSQTGQGVVIARGDQLPAAYYWRPAMTDNGRRILVAAVFDRNGLFLAGDAVPVQVDVIPQVQLTGINEGQVIKDGISLGANLNFSPEYVKYLISNLDKEKVFVSPEADPYGAYQWTGTMEDNGNLSIKVAAYDEAGHSYESPAVEVKAAVARKLLLAGVSAGKTIAGPVILSTVRNFQVSETEYLIIDPNNGKEKSLAKIGFGSCSWFPGPDMKGIRQILVRVRDTRGADYFSSRISVNLTGTPQILLEGIGPGQVISDTVQLKSISNVSLAGIKYSLINGKTGARRDIAASQDDPDEFAYSPQSGDGGAWKIQAEGRDSAGNKILSEAIPVTIFTGKIYQAVPIIAKSRFQEMAAAMAEHSWQKTGMSAALQTAQAILETGWGQSVPVDKYTGQLSYNLFGIKGKGPAGSVVVNTWEEYNGQAYRIDAKFRAYHSAIESWDDHKQLLLTASRYKIFREVMHDSRQGAWALKRAGYATDSKYPLKLLEIIKRYDLQKLDQVGI